MNVPLKININDNQEQTVSGRELHAFLEIGTKYKDWFPRMCEYGFVEGTDYNPLKKEQVQFEGNREVKREVADHILKLDMAKELCMLARNEKGKQARQYFLQVEREWNSPEKVMARALLFANKKIESQNLVIEEQAKQIEIDKPKVIFADAVSASEDCILIRDLAKLLNQNGIDMGEKKLFEYLRQNGYLIKKEGSDKNMPTQRAMEKGLFKIKETTINCPDGKIRISKTPKVTGRGQTYFINKFKSEQGA